MSKPIRTFVPYVGIIDVYNKVSEIPSEIWDEVEHSHWEDLDGEGNGVTVYCSQDNSIMLGVLD